MADLIRDANPQPPAPPPMRPRPDPPDLGADLQTRVSLGSSPGPSVPVNKPTQEPGDDDAVLATERERYIQCLKEVEQAKSAVGPGVSVNRIRLCELAP